MLESCKGSLTLKAIAKMYGVAIAAMIRWLKKYLGKNRKKRMLDPSPQKSKDIVQLQKKKPALKEKIKALTKEHYLL